LNRGSAQIAAMINLPNQQASLLRFPVYVMICWCCILLLIDLLRPETISSVRSLLSLQNASERNDDSSPKSTHSNGVVPLGSWIRYAIGKILCSYWYSLCACWPCLAI